MGQKFNINTFEEKINLFFPGWEHEIILFTQYKQPAIVKCLTCGKIIQLKKASDISRKINICSCYHYFEDYHDKLRYFSELFNFQILDDGSAQTKKIIRCNHCGMVMERSLVSLLNTSDHCDQCHNYSRGIPLVSQDEAQEKLDNSFHAEYELIQYQGMSKEALLKHRNCGYIFKIRELGDLFEGRNRGCPKCYQFKSRGEQKIRDFLDSHQIHYIPQKAFAPLNKSKYRFDFYLPDFNLAIEYQGEQHYRGTSFFRDDLTAIQKRDNIKRNYCQINNIELLEIKYTELKQIDAILSSKFNDYLKRE